MIVIKENDEFREEIQEDIQEDIQEAVGAEAPAGHAAGEDDGTGKQSVRTRGEPEPIELLAEKEEQVNELNNRLQRLQADFDNFRRRTRQEREEFFKSANQDLITTLLPALDNLQRALAACNLKDDPFMSGVNMIYKQIMQILTCEGLTPIEAVGQKFDPKLHEAVQVVESEEHELNEIVEELQKGYQLKGKVIRASMVKVANSR